MKKLSRILCCVISFMLLLCCVPAEIFSSAASFDWVSSWGTPAIGSSITLSEYFNVKDFIPAGSTVRTVITPTLGGTKIRLKFSNEYGSNSITINETTVAYTGTTDDVVDASSITQVTFNGGQTAVTIAPGSEVYSDEISFKVTALQKISVSCYYKNTTTLYTTGMYGGISYLASSLGNRTHKETMTTVATRLDFTSGSITYHTIPFLTRLDVYAQDSYCVSIIGDSTVTNDIYLMLAKKCIDSGITNVGFIMSGIIGNALLRDGEGMLGASYGTSLLERFKRDALNLPNCKYIILKIGENDILHPMLESMQGVLPSCSASKVTTGYKTLAEQFVNTDVKVYLCTRTPFKGYTRNFLGSDDLTWTQEGEDKLLAINEWIVNYCTKYGYSGYINLDAVRDPKDSAKLYDHMTTDGVHFSTYGQIAVTDLIPEAAYGVGKEIKDYADIVGVDPYVAPVSAETTTSAKTESTTKAENTTTATDGNNTAQETTTAVQNSPTVNAGNSNEPTTYNTGSLIITEPTTNNANEILLGDDLQNNGVVGSVSDDSSGNTRQIVGFVLLALIGAVLVATAIFMLGKINPSKISLGRASYDGRAKQRKKGV